MSAGVTSTTNSYFSRTTAPAPDGFSACGLCMITNKGNGAPGTGQFGNIFGIFDATHWCQIGFDDFSHSGNLTVTSNGGDAAFASTPALNTPFFWYMIGGTGPTLDAGWSPLSSVSFTTLSLTGTSFTANEMSWMGDSFGEYVYGYMESLKVWSTAMTQGQMMCELFSKVPKTFASSHLWSPLPSTSDIKDHFSGTGRDWTANGTGTVSGDGMPVHLGAQGRHGRKISAAAPPPTAGRFFFGMAAQSLRMAA